MSRRAVICLFFGVILLATLPAWASLQQFAVFIGNNRGDAGETPLRYAESDATRLRDALTEVGRFPPENTVLLLGQNSQEVQRVLISVNDRVRAGVSEPATRVVLFVFYSGHADASSLHLSGTHLELSTLEQLVRSSAAGFRVLIVDACRSGVLTRVKGGRSAPPFPITVSAHLPGQGVVFLTSSSANEDAQESDALRGSFFTHYFRTGLLGPADRDASGEVTLDEAYRYAYENTLRASSRSWAGLQHPTYRYELRGQGGIVLAYLRATQGGRGVLRFPEGRTYLVFEGTEQGGVAGEVPVFARPRVLSLRAGGYFVRGRTAGSLLEGQVRVTAGMTLEVADSMLSRVEYAQLVRKGAEEQHLVHGPQLAYLFRTALPNQQGLCHGAALAYPIVSRTMEWVPRLYFCRGGFANAALSASTSQFATELEVATAWDFSWGTPRLLVVGGVSLLRQEFDGSVSVPSRNSLSGYAGVGAGLTVMLHDGMYAFAQGTGEAHLLPMSATGSGAEQVVGAGVYRQMLGLGKYW